MLASCHLNISSACCPQYIWLEPILPIIPVDSGLLRFQLSLWSFDCGLLCTRNSACVSVLSSQASSKTLKSCWYPVILRSWECYSAWKWCLLWGLWSCLVCSKPGYTSSDQKEPKPLISQGSRVLAPAVTGLAQVVWNRCCVSLTSDPKIEWRVLWGLWDLPPVCTQNASEGTCALAILTK
jgi:hypothetical protein